MKDLTKMTAPEIWDYFVELRGYREPNGDLEDDGFFNDKFLCIKYGDWDTENECRKYDVTNAELRSMLDKKETTEYINYMQLCIEELNLD